MNRLFCAFFVLLVVPCLLVTDVHAGDELEQEFQKAASGTVSYTHLTLPTIYSV